jgi:hypothetical protein
MKVGFQRSGERFSSGGWPRGQASRPGNAHGGAIASSRIPATPGDKLSRRLWFLDSANLRADARKRTGLEDFGDPPVEPALSVLTQSLEQEANLHPLGRFLMRVHLRDLLETRLRLAELWRGQSGSLVAEPIGRPIFITGMPRSGSTFLHELMAEDPASRVPRVWEVMFPVPGRKPRPAGPDSRVRRAAACLWWFRRLAPQADAVFPMRAQTPHECVAIQSYSFLSEEFLSTCRIPGYEAFIRAADLRPAYAWQRRFMQHLQSGGAARQWVLKSPDHARSLEALFAVFPDALIIQTHRNPLEVLESSFQLTEVLQGLYSRPGRRAELAARESRLLAGAMDHLIQFRDAHPQFADRFVDVNYGELVADPIAVVGRIYERYEIPLSHAAADRMRALAASRSRYRGRRQGRVTGIFRPDASAEMSCFKRYCARFRIAWPQPQL